MSDSPISAATQPAIGVFDSGFGGLTVLRALIQRMPHSAVCVYRRYGAAALRIQVAAHHRSLRCAKCAVPGSRTGRSVPGDRLQHGQRAGARCHSGCCARPRAGCDRARRFRSPPGLARRRCRCRRHRRHCTKPRLRNSLPGSWFARPAKACPLLVPLVEEGWTDHAVTAEVIRIYLDELKAEAAAQGHSNPIRWSWAAPITRCCVR